jgi:hypothetical protein
MLWYENILAWDGPKMLERPKNISFEATKVPKKIMDARNDSCFSR